MLYKLIFIAFLFITIKTFPQSPTYQALVKLNYNVDNNKFSLDTKPQKKDFSERKNFIWDNVYFRYFKNPNTMGSQKPDEAMKFSIINQYFYKLFWDNDEVFAINLAKGAKDKIINVHINLFNTKGNKVVSSKLKGISYSLIKEDKNLKLVIKKGVIKQGSILQILINIESFNFNKLGPFNFNKPTPDNYNYILTANIPEMFLYNIPKELNLVSEKVESLRLKEFTYSNPPIVDYNANSYSYRWSINPTQTDKEIIFKLDSINITKDIGTSTKQLMKTSE